MSAPYGLRIGSCCGRAGLRLASSPWAAALAAVAAAFTVKVSVTVAGAPNWSITWAVTEKLPGPGRVWTAAGVKNTAPSEKVVLNCRMKPSGSCDVTEQARTVVGETLRRGTTVTAALGGRSLGSPLTSTAACEVAPVESVASAVM